jgi:hypothetical protein
MSRITGCWANAASTGDLPAMWMVKLMLSVTVRRKRPPGRWFTKSTWACSSGSMAAVTAAISSAVKAFR